MPRTSRRSRPDSDRLGESALFRGTEAPGRVRDELRAALERTGVTACADLPARVLSAGQRRRVSLARVLAMNAPLWLLDEPYSNLDAAGSELVSSGLLQAHVTAGGLALVVAHRELELNCQVRRLELHL